MKTFQIDCKQSIFRRSWMKVNLFFKGFFENSMSLSLSKNLSPIFGFWAIAAFSFSTPSTFAANANLFVSAEDSRFDNYFGGPMVIQVVVIDSDINDTDEAKGEPFVTVNGRTLKMAQGVDGWWHGFFRRPYHGPKS